MSIAWEDIEPVDLGDHPHPRGLNILIRSVVFIPEPMFYIQRRNVVSGKLEDVMVDMDEVKKHHHHALKVFLDYYTDARQHIEHPEQRIVKKARWEYGVVPAFASRIADELALVEEQQSDRHPEEPYCDHNYCNIDHHNHYHEDADTASGERENEESESLPAADSGASKGEDEAVDDQPAAVSYITLVLYQFLIISDLAA